MLNGEIGSLVQDGKQLGGFLEWSIDLELTSLHSPQGREYKKVMTKAMANKYWLLSEPSRGKIIALYYQLLKKRLVLVNQAEVKVDLGTVLNKIINKPLEMIWMS